MMARDLTQKQPRYALDLAFYDRVRAARPQYKLTESFIVPPYSGKGCIAKKGQTFRVIQETGPQIADVGIWNANDRREVFSAMRTWMLDGWIIRKNCRMWSELPYLRPMATCIEDTVVAPPGVDYHHHFVGTHCGPETVEKRFGVPGLNGCRINLLQGIEPFGLTEDDLRENINLHERNHMDPVTGRRSIARGDMKVGDYVEFYCEMDLIVSVSVCPFGDGSHNPTMWRDKVCRPLRVENYETGIAPKAFPQVRS